MIEHRACDPANILLVEDNPGDVRLTEEAFKEGQINNTLHVVEDGIKALDFLFQRNEYADAPRPDIVLLDLNLPRKNGDEVVVRRVLAVSRPVTQLQELIQTRFRQTTGFWQGLPW